MLTKNRQGGFTLIELMIVVAIIALLAAIAFPSYQEYVRKTRRTAAAGCMTEVSQFMERYYTTNMTYVGAAVPNLTCTTETSRYYTISLTAAATASAFTLQAVPTTLQNDAKCGTLTIDQKGVKTKSGTASSVANCF